MSAYKPHLCRHFLPKKKMGLQSRKLFCEPVWHLWIENCTNRFCLQMIHRCEARAYHVLWISVHIIGFFSDWWRLLRYLFSPIKSLFIQKKKSMGLDDLEEHMHLNPRNFITKTTWNHDFASWILLDLEIPYPIAKKKHRKLQTLWGYFEKFSLFSTNHLVGKKLYNKVVVVVVLGLLRAPKWSTSTSSTLKIGCIVGQCAITRFLYPLHHLL